MSKDNKPSPKMEEFLDEVDKLCFKYKFEILPRTKKLETGEYDHLIIKSTMFDNELVKILYIDGDGRGK